jgi:pyruvate-ferredoxin/flavodoxin oxidoreductase
LLPQIYCLDAAAVAEEVGLGRRVNMVLQTAFFAISGVVPMEEVRPWGRGDETHTILTI